MKVSLLLLSLFAGSAVLAQEHRLEKLWETDTVIAVPESVLPDAKRNIMFVSLIDGGSWDADGKGGIGKMSFDGKTYDGTWIKGLHAPKGMAIGGNRLYVADITDVVVINIEEGKIEKRIAPDSAKGLNDVTITDNNIVYASDSRTGRVWRIENDKPTLYLENLKGVNGLKAVGDDLYVGAGKMLVRVDAEKHLTPIAEVSQGIDGIEPIGNGDFLVTAWSGYIWYVAANGQVTTLLETHQQKKNTADIGYDPATKIMYVPTFNGKTVVAYSVK